MKYDISNIAVSKLACLVITKIQKAFLITFFKFQNKKFYLLKI